MRKRPWSDLLPELLSMIGYWLHTCIDLLWLRSVCSLFRSSVPLLRCDATWFPFHISCLPGSTLILYVSTVYARETLEGATFGHARGVGGWGHVNPSCSGWSSPYPTSSQRYSILSNSESLKSVENTCSNMSVEPKALFDLCWKYWCIRIVYGLT